MDDHILEMRGISKSFPGVMALKDVNFSVRRGEVHCLVGENGAGKSTLMKILSGIHAYGNYAGEIRFDGKTVRFHGIRDSERTGISIISQELALIPDLTVAENIFFGHEQMRGLLVDWPQTRIRAAEYLAKVQLRINPDSKVRDLRVGHQQLVEIAKALSKRSRLLILDEPTSSLNEEDSANLLLLLKKLQQEGVTIIMISHRLKEVISIADTITVLRDGASVCSLDARNKAVSENMIIRSMVGREIDTIYPKRPNHEVGPVRFAIKNWSVFDRKRDREILHDVSMEIREGEIVGLAGLMGAGRTELALSIFGNTPEYRITGGELQLDGRRVHFSSPKAAIDAGLAYATEDRKRNGLILKQDIRFNTTFANLKALLSHHTINRNEEIAQAKKLKEELNIKAPSVQQTAMNLSGGNQQKVVLAKWIFAQPRIMILDEPTRGIDVGSKHEIYTLMNQMVRQGMSILMISSELLEILGMSDRIYVMCEGMITGELDAAHASEEGVMKLATQTWRKQVHG